MDNDNREIIQVSMGLLAALSGNGLSVNVMPQEILALECIVAGTSFRDLSKVETGLKVKVKIGLKREKDNQYDRFAVSLWYEGSKIGYLPKTKNETIARLLDAGKQFFALLEAKDKEGGWLRLDIKVYLKD